MRLTVLAAILIAPSFLAWGQSGAVTLDEATRAALANGDDMRILQGTLETARAQYAVDKAKDSATLSVSAGYGASHDVSTPVSATERALGGGLSSVAGPQAGVGLSAPLTSVSLNAYPYVPSTSSKTSSTPAEGGFGLVASQTLWNGYPGGPARAVVQKSALSLDGAELNASSGRLNLVHNVALAYYTMLNAQRQLVVLQDNLTRQNALLEQLTAMNKLQQASAVDLATAQINARSAAIDLRSGEHDLRIARIKLSNLAGWPADREYSVAETGEPAMPTVTLQAAIADGLSTRPELKQIDISRRSSEIDLRLAHGLSTPTVSVSAGVSWGGEWTSTAASGAVVAAAVTVGMPLLDAGNAKHQAEKVAQQQAVYAAQESQERKTIATDIQNAYESMQILSDRLAVARLSAQNLEAQFEVTRTAVQYGTKTNQDLLDASVNAANGRTAAAKAQSDLELAVLQLRAAMGY
jgi:outer membrane protein TolC